MGPKRVRLWDAEQHESYVRQRDQALERRADERLGTRVAAEIDSILAALAGDDARDVLDYLLLAGASACIGKCNDGLLARLVEHGLLTLPPGVRPVLTDDLVTTFQVPPAAWAALQRRRDDLLPPPAERALRMQEAGQRFRDRIAPIAISEAPDPNPQAAQEHQDP
jgi:hypothetical protein